MQTQLGSTDIVPLGFELGAQWTLVVVTLRPLYPRERTPVPIAEAWWAPESGWLDLKMRKSPSPTGIRTPVRPAHTLVPIPTTQHRPPVPNYKLSVFRLPAKVTDSYL